MIKDRGLILRIVPYSDSSVIIRCFTDSDGVVPLFARLPQRKRQSGHLQTGSFIEFTAQQRATSMLSVKESRWDSSMPNQQLPAPALGVWMFTIELLQKSLAEKLALPALKQRIDHYYAHLLHGAISTDALIPLVVISNSLGLCDATRLPLAADVSIKDDLDTLGFAQQAKTTAPIDPTDIFAFELERFSKHFEIAAIDSLALL